jgi:hypothetical protein
MRKVRPVKRRYRKHRHQQELESAGLRQCFSTRLNLLNRYWGQHKHAEKNKNKTGLPLLRPQLPQIDSNGADRGTKQAYD